MGGRQEAVGTTLRITDPRKRDLYVLTFWIGTAHGANVYRATFLPNILDQSDKRDIILKIVPEESPAHKKLIEQLKENAFLNGNENILQVTNHFVSGSDFHVVMPYMAGCSLQSLMSRSFNYGLPEKCIAIALNDTLLNLCFLHNNGKFHREICAKHIFVDTTKRSMALAFRASVYQELDRNTNASWDEPLICSWGAAPEAEYTTKADIWLIGITALELAWGCKVPSNRQDLDSRIKNEIKEKSEKKGAGLKGKIMPLPFLAPVQKAGETELSRSFWKMVAWCLAANPMERPTAHELLGDTFFKNRSGNLRDFIDTVAQQGNR